MFTICPKCTLTLVVTTVDLRAGQGYVRCGRCANVFNALIALREGDPTNLPPRARDSESSRRLRPHRRAAALGSALRSSPNQNQKQNLYRNRNRCWNPNQYRNLNLRPKAHLPKTPLPKTN